jgi:hypothetical protein
VSVEIGVVDAHSPLAGFLGSKHRVGKPNRVLHSLMNPTAKSFHIFTLMTSL